MKKITVTLTDEAEKVFNEIMYALPKEEDGTGMCNQSEAICHALQRMDFLEEAEESHPTPEYELQLCEKCHQMTNHIADVCQKCKTPTPEISEEGILTEFEKKNNPFYPNQMKWQRELLLKLISWAITKGAKPVSKVRIGELWEKHKGKFLAIFNRADFEVFIKELNNK